MVYPGDGLVVLVNDSIFYPWFLRKTAQGKQDGQENEKVLFHMGWVLATGKPTQM